MSDKLFSDIQDPAERKAALLDSALGLFEELRAETASMGEDGTRLATRLNQLEQSMRVIAEIDSGTAD